MIFDRELFLLRVNALLNLVDLPVVEFSQTELRQLAGLKFDSKHMDEKLLHELMHDGLTVTLSKGIVFISRNEMRPSHTYTFQSGFLTLSKDELRTCISTGGE